MLQFISTPVVKKLNVTNEFYHGIILHVDSYTWKDVEYLSVTIGMKDAIFKTSVRSIIVTDHPLHEVGLDLLDEFGEGTLLSEDDFIGLVIRFKVTDANETYSRLTKVELDHDVDEETCKNYKRR